MSMPDLSHLDAQQRFVYTQVFSGVCNAGKPASQARSAATTALALYDQCPPRLKTHTLIARAIKAASK